jgi:hypothetical protein
MCKYTQLIPTDWLGEQAAPGLGERGRWETVAYPHMQVGEMLLSPKLSERTVRP